MPPINSDGKNLNLRQVLSSRLNALQPDLTGSLDAELADAEDAIQVLRTAIGRPTVHGDTRRVLELHRDVLLLTDGNEILLAHVLQEPQIVSCSAIATKYYNTRSIDKVTVASLAAFKRKLFEREPQAVIQALLQNGELLNKQPELRMQILRVLERATQQNIDMATPQFEDSARQVCSEDDSHEVDEKQLSEEIGQIAETARAFKRLAYLASDPKQIEQLFTSNFKSAHDIAMQNRASFKAVMKNSRVTEEEALRIHDHATSIDCRNQETWVRILKGIKDGVEAPPTAPGVKPAEAAATAQVATKVATTTGLLSRQKEGKRFNLTDLFYLQSMSCSECCSVTSASAYFVDLMQFLKTSSCQRDAKDSPRSALDVLLARRPDLEHLQLSCANNKMTRPYAAIVNEVLSSYILYQEGHSDKMIAVHNENDESIPPSNESPDATVAAVFQSEIADQWFPMATFPYSHSISAVRTALTALGISRLEVMSTFRSVARIDFIRAQNAASSTAISDTGNSSADGVVRRGLVAESLGLQPLDYTAITGENLDPLDSLPPPSVAKLWGYASVEAMLNDDETSAVGLGFVKAQLLVRTGVTFSELQDIVNSLYFGRRLVITSVQQSKAFTSDVSQMRLRMFNLSREKIVKLDADVCRELQSFVRLKTRLGWSVSELDNAISCVSQNRVANGQIGRAKTYQGISPQMLEDIADIIELCNLTGVSVMEALPLWSEGMLGGNNELYRRLFLQGAVESTQDNIFKPDSAGKLFAEPDAIDQHIRTIQIALRTTPLGLTSLLSLAGLDLTQDLNVSNLAKLYRQRLICRMLDVEPEEFVSRRLIWPSTNRLFFSPASTLQHVKSWRALTSSKWTKESIDHVMPSFRPADLYSPSYVKQAVDLARPLIDGSEAFETKWSTALSEGSVTEDQVREACSLLFESSVAQSTAALVHGQPLRASMAVAAADVQPLPSMTGDEFSKISVESDLSTGTLSITFKDMLSVQEKQQIAEACKLNQPFLNCVKELDTRIMAPLRVISSKIFPRLSEAQQAEAVSLLTSRAVIPNNSANDSERGAYEQQMRNRRSSFIRLALPALRSQVQENLLLDICTTQFPDTGKVMLSMLMNETVEVRAASNTSGSSSISPREALEAIPTRKNSARSLHAAYFSIERSGDYDFTMVGRDQSPDCAINGVKLDLQKTPSGWGVKNKKLVGGQYYHISSSVDIRDATWSTASDNRPISTSRLYVPVDCAETMYRIVESIRRVTALVSTLALSREEVRFLSADTGPVQINLNNISVTDLRRLEQYRELRDSSGKPSQDLLSLMEWMHIAPNRLNVEELPRRLGLAFGWSTDEAQELVSAKYQQLPYDQVIQRLSNWDEMLHLVGAARCRARINGALETQLSAEFLFHLAEPITPKNRQAEGEGASVLQASMSESQRSNSAISMRDQQRKTLVNYLLQQSYILDKNIATPDGLFDYFLIDVQMGGALVTTRMKQAISTVQLFVQRCLLGLEVHSGVLSSQIKRTRWAWMRKFNVWQATRKAYLYPENWIDPSLRDDKTEVFQAYETGISQGDLSWNSFVTHLKKYVLGLNQVADLDIVSYLRTVEDQVSEVYHFFGRSRSAPFQYYYRKMQRSHGASHVFWSSWSKIELDVPLYVTDWNGSNIGRGGNYLLPVLRGNRMFLYVPEITAKSIPTKRKPAASLQGAKPGEKRTAVRTETKPETMRTVKDQPLDATRPTQEWEIRLAWTELFDGTWTAKQVSQECLKVEWDATFPEEPLPSIANFTFGTASSTHSTVEITVGCWKAELSPASYELGMFKIYDDRIAVTSYKGDEQNQWKDLTAATKFHKYTWHGNDSTVPTISTRSNNRECIPLLAVPKKPDLKSRTLTWTLSFNVGSDQRDATGLVVDQQDSDAPGRSMLMYSETLSKSDATNSSLLRENSKVIILEHETSSAFMDALNSQGELDELLKHVASMPIEDFGDAVDPNGKQGGRHELTLPYAIYNWEVGLHAILLAVDRFAATQQFDLALQAARLIFDPTVDAVGETPELVSPACWRFKPFSELASQKSNMMDIFAGWPQDSVVDAAVIERRANPSTAFSTARSRPQAYMKWIIIKYVEILVAAGDDLFRRSSLEDLPLAIQRYTEAAFVLGPEPLELPKLGKPVILTYSDFDNNKTGTTKEVDLELAFPFICAIDKRGTHKAEQYSDPDEQSILCFMRSPYFCLPPNPKFATLRSLVKDRLYKTRNNLDINGRPVVYSIDEQTIVPGDLALGQSYARSDGSAMSGQAEAPIPYQRFTYCMGKAMELCNELRAVSEQLLSVREKKDSEALTVLKLRQDATKQKYLTNIKQLQQQEVTKSLEGLSLQRESAESHLSYLLELMGEPLERIPDEKTAWEDIQQRIEAPTSEDLRMSSFERQEMDSADYSASLSQAASSNDQIIAYMRAFPRLSMQGQPFGWGVTITADSHNVADGLTALNMGKRNLAMVAMDAGQQASRKAQLTRQLQDRRLQANLKGREIKLLDKQIESQRTRLQIVAAEIQIQQEEINALAETQAFFQSKYTNEKLFAWMEKSLRAVSYETYLLALDLARHAERVFRFEKGPGHQSSFLLRSGYWQANHDGMLVAQQLALDLRRMEIAYLEKPTHDFEITKNISLRQLDPLALVVLREKGVATFSIPETIFDMDWPGHYRRRIKSVSVSVPCITGPYTSLSGTLTLLQHRYRVKNRASSAKEYTSKGDESGQFQTDRIPISAIAVSSGMQDNGLFELNYRDDRFQPFEYAGAISTWRFELPTTHRSFDYNSISDVVLHLRYTSLDGGALLRSAASGAVQAMCTQINQVGANDGLVAYFDLKNDFSSEWYAFQAELKRVGAIRKPVGGDQAQQQTPAARLSLSRIGDRLPYWARGKKVTLRSVSLNLDGSGDISAKTISLSEIVGMKEEAQSGTNIRLGAQEVETTLPDVWALEYSPGTSQEPPNLNGASLIFRYSLSG